MRIDRDELFMEVAALFAKRSTCPRANVGAVIIRNKRIISTGYNGAPATMAHCTEVGCDFNMEGVVTPKEDSRGCTRAVHAEANAIAYAAREGIALHGATLFTTHSPCIACAQLIINAGIKEVVYSKAYRDPRGLSLLDEAGVEFYEYGSGQS